MPMLFPPASFPRLVVKIGSALLIERDGGVRRAWLGGIAADVAARAQAGQQVAIVSSGAIAQEDGGIGARIRVKTDPKNPPIFAEIVDAGIVRVPGFK